MTLQRLVIDFRNEESVLRCLYRTGEASGASPNTKARRREVQELAREGLRQALKVLESGAECVGTSGFTTREDVLSATISPVSEKPMKIGA